MPPGKSEKRSENYSKPSANPVLNVRDDTQKRSYTRSEEDESPSQPVSKSIDRGFRKALHHEFVPVEPSPDSWLSSSASLHKTR